MIYLLALLIGVVAGLRTMSAPTAVSLAAYLGWISLAGTPLAFLASTWAIGILGLLAVLELIADKLPTTGSRKGPVQFGARLLTAGVSGAAIGATAGLLLPGLAAGLVGAVLGTYGGSALRGRLAGAFGRDLPAALTEDVLAVGGALLIVSAV
jgi:uncharacterized membrane protein